MHLWCTYQSGRTQQSSAQVETQSQQSAVANQHYGDVIMSTTASQITSVTIVCAIVYSGVDQRKHQSSASLDFVWGIHLWPVNSPHKGPVTRKMVPFDDIIMGWSLPWIHWPGWTHCPHNAAAPRTSRQLMATITEPETRLLRDWIGISVMGGFLYNSSCYHTRTLDPWHWFRSNLRPWNLPNKSNWFSSLFQMANTYQWGT